MAKRKRITGKSDTTSATVGYEAELWRMADALRGFVAGVMWEVAGWVFGKFVAGSAQYHAVYSGSVSYTHLTLPTN